MSQSCSLTGFPSTDTTATHMNTPNKTQFLTYYFLHVVKKKEWEKIEFLKVLGQMICKNPGMELWYSRLQCSFSHTLGSLMNKGEFQLLYKGIHLRSCQTQSARTRWDSHWWCSSRLGWFCPPLHRPPVRTWLASQLLSLILAPAPTAASCQSSCPDSGSSSGEQAERRTQA